MLTSGLRNEIAITSIFFSDPQSSFRSSQRTYSLVVEAWDWDNGTRNSSELTFLFPKHFDTQSLVCGVPLLQFVRVGEASEASGACAGKLPQGGAPGILHIHLGKSSGVIHFQVVRM